MRVALELPAVDGADSSTASTLRNSQGSATQASADAAAANAETTTPQVSKPDATPEPLSLSFRKDSSGTTYYVILDSQTGQVVREVPPEEVRQVGDGIEQYLKAQAALATPKTDTKA